MWYTLGHANTFICTPAHGGRAGHAGGRSPVLVRLYGPSLSEPPRQCRGPDDDPHSTEFSGGALRCSQYPCHFNTLPLHHVSSAPTADMEMRHGTDHQSNTPKPHHH